jgi:hypothetical protein
MKFLKPLAVLLGLPLAALAQLDSAKHHRNARLTPLPVVYYSPETRWGFGALVAANFETDKIRGGITRSSYSQTYALYTANHQYDIGNTSRIYFPQNRFIVFNKLNFSHFPEYYFGLSTEEPLLHKDTISYHRIAEDFRFYWAWKKNYYVGLASRFNSFSSVTSGPGSFINEKPLGYDGYSILGFAPAITIETRDSFVYPRRGFYLEVLYYLYPKWNARSFAFQQLRLDVRKYFPVQLISKIDVVAFQFIANLNSGDAPFKDMADLGGSSMMRGYYSGYYRYKNLYAFQMEYRANVWKRLGFSVWLGGALTSENWYAPFDRAVKPNAGLGLRVMMNRQDKLNVRVDQGYGKNGQSGFYLDIAEAY